MTQTVNDIKLHMCRLLQPVLITKTSRQIWEATGVVVDLQQAVHDENIKVLSWMTLFDLATGLGYDVHIRLTERD